MLRENGILCFDRITINYFVVGLFHGVVVSLRTYMCDINLSSDVYLC